MAGKKLNFLSNLGNQTTDFRTLNDLSQCSISFSDIFRGFRKKILAIHQQSITSITCFNWYLLLPNKLTKLCSLVNNYKN